MATLKTGSVKKRKYKRWPTERRRTRSTAKSFHLLSLPAELRRMIYRYCVVPPKPIEIPKIGALAHFTNIQLTCKQVRSEIVPIFYRENCFKWCGSLFKGGLWGKFLRGPIKRIHSLMMPVRDYRTCCRELTGEHQLLVFIASRECRLLFGGPGRLKLRHLYFDVSVAQPPPFSHVGSIPLGSTGFFFPPSFHSPADYTEFPRVKTLQSVRFVTSRSIDQRWVERAKRESGCTVEVIEKF